MASSNDTPASPPSTQHNSPASSTLRPGRKLNAAWDTVEIDPQGGVWCKKYKALLQTTGRIHVERIKHHLAKRCTAQGTTTLITDTYRPRIKSERTKKFQEQLAWWVYSTGMAFYKIGHSSLLDALRLMNPVPSADQLSTTLLDRAYTKSLRATEKSLSGKVATLVTDAWTDINGQPVMNYVVVCGENTHFLESVYTGAQAHDTEYLAVDIERVIAKYSFLKIGVVVTDNTRANQVTWKAIEAVLPISG